MLPRRLGAYSPTWLDQLCASGEVVWLGAGALGRNTGRVAPYFREDVAQSARRPARGEAPRTPRTRSSASGSPRAPRFFTDLLAELDLPPEELQEALWDLAWAGEATNDAWAPLRAPRLTLARAQRERARRGACAASARAGRAPPAQVQGRWSLTAAAVPRRARPGAKRRATAELLLERYGIVTREQVLAEGIPGGFSALYDSLGAARDARRRPPRLLRRGARRRAVRAAGRGGAAAGDPRRGRRARRSCSPRPTRRSPTARRCRGRSARAPGPRRQAGAHVVLVAAEPVLYLERGGRGSRSLAEPATARRAAPSTPCRARPRRPDQAPRPRARRRRARRRLADGRTA